MPSGPPARGMCEDLRMTKTDRPAKESRTVFLCGLKGCGKTTLARKAASMLGCTSMDCDEMILRMNPGFTTCRQLFKTIGEKAFRAEESKAAKAIARLCGENGGLAIVALGGGACDADDVLSTAKDNGILVYLYQTEHVLFERMKANGLPPYLDEAIAEQQFHQLYERRNEIYSCSADYVIQLSDCTEDEAVSALEGLLK